MPDAPSDLARLLSLIAHELRTPLSVTSGYVKMLASERPGPLTDGQRQVVAGAGRACDMLAALGTDLSLLGRLERGEVTPMPVAVDLPALVAEIAAGYTSHPDHPVTVRVVSSVPVTLRADIGHLRRALRAFLAAVVRAAPDHVTVDIAWRTPGTSQVTGGAASTGSGHAVAAATASAAATTAVGDAGPGEAASVHIGFAEADRVEALIDAAASSLQPLDDSQAGLGLALPIAARLMALEGGTIGAVHETQALGVRLTLPLRA